MKRINEIIDFCDSSLSYIDGLIETNTPTNKSDIMSILTDLYIGSKNATAWFEKNDVLQNDWEDHSRYLDLAWYNIKCIKTGDTDILVLICKIILINYEIAMKYDCSDCYGDFDTLIIK